MSDGILKITSKYCKKFLGQKVVVHHVSGHIYRGRLHSVTDDGIYLMRAKLLTPVSASVDDWSVDYAIADTDEDADISEAFFPFLFLPFIALAGLAAARRPYYPPYGYGYGYGYPGPGPWYY